MGWAERDADRAEDRRIEAEENAEELVKLREVIGRIAVLAHHGLAKPSADEFFTDGAHLTVRTNALLWIKKTCDDAGHTVTSVNGAPT